MEFNECVDINYLKFLKSLKKKELFRHFNTKNKKEQQKIYDRIINYCDKMLKCNGKFKHIYKYTLNTNSGRLYSGTSIQGLPKPIRGLLFKNTTDYDMVNAHPTILLYLCKKHNLDKNIYSNLDYYVNNREIVLENGDRNEIKKTILKSIYDKNRNRSAEGFLKHIDNDLKKIQKKMVNIEDYKEIVDEVPSYKLYNFYGSALSRIICKYENEILHDMIHITNKNGLEITAPMFDGLLINGDNNVIDDMENYLNERWNGLNMKISIKEHDNSIVYNENQIVETNSYESILSLMKDKGLQTYEETKELFEETHCKIIDLSLFFKEIKNNEEVLYKSFTESSLKTSYKHLKYYTPIKDKNDIWNVSKQDFIFAWLCDENIRTYNDVNVIPPPLKCPDHILNMWCDFTFNSEKYENYTEMKTEVDFILNHIKILCNNEIEVYEYFCKWIGQMIQYPAVKTICPVLISKQGAGKGTFMRMMERMMGSKKVFETTTPSRDVWGQFNGLMVNTFLVNLNELSKKETIESESQIKGLITDAALTINNKGQNAMKITSHHRFIISTNKEEPINTSSDDRRNLIIRCSDQLINNKNYFEKINDYIDDDNVIKSLFEYFKSIPNLNKFNKLEKPTTTYQENLKELSKNPIELFIEDLIMENFDEYNLEYTTKELYQEFNKYISKGKYNYECNYQKFSCRLNRLNHKGIINKRTNRGTIKIFDINVLKKELNIGCDIDLDLIEEKNEIIIEEKTNEIIEEKKPMTIKCGNQSIFLDYNTQYGSGF